MTQIIADDDEYDASHATSTETTTNINVSSHHIDGNNENEEDDGENDEFLFSPKSTIDISQELLDYSHLSESYILEHKRSHQPPRRLFDDDDDDVDDESNHADDNDDDNHGYYVVEGDVAGDNNHDGSFISSMLFMSMSTSLLDAETSFESCSSSPWSYIIDGRLSLHHR